MPDKQKNAKASRAHKESKGQHGSGGRVTHSVTVTEKVRNERGQITDERTREVNRRGLTEINKILLGKGAFRGLAVKRSRDSIKK